MTQRELAERLHVTPSAISNYENSHSQPSLEFLCQISECLQVSSDYLLGLTPHKKPVDEIFSVLSDIGNNERLKRFITDLALAPKAKRELIILVANALLRDS